MSTKIKDVTKSQIFPAINSDKLALVVFHQKNCGACIMFEPVLEKLVEKMDVVVYKVDIHADMSYTREVGIQGTPTILVYKHGVLSNTLVGYRSLDQLQKAL
ncbi:thioredoxin family protein [Mesomycoplasma hyorhinis]|uniref:thioredoxin family protein n=1 Tax=Mesomycoplasma hyorhinis TaxID=2100 RepID=UPI001C057DC1|nr:thioredoxin family protein [Mesomycoplasma hyorhinis]UVT32087.1 thioredoxin family protein [Mesomycoplasma hyorhinis]UVT32765.1 thioredoxin family protein [Mesomycoplasma hyorhinis]UVT33441.1 thioredoxin family protein [Mesomycoplasma hyorhinis]